MNKNIKSITRSLKPYFIAMILLLVSLSTIAPASCSPTDEILHITYSFQRPLMETIDIEGTVYDRVLLPDCSPAGNTGEPMVPSKGAYILLPPKSKVSNIHIKSGEKIVLGVEFTVVPTSKPIPLSQAISPSVPTPDATIYNADAFYPGTLYTEVGTYSFRGYNLLVLLLHPIQYNPVTGELFYYKNLEVSIETISDDNSVDLFRGLEKDKIEVMKKVDNPELSEQYHEESAKPSSMNEDYDLLIITTDSLKNDFEPLKQAHDATGIDTVIKTLTDIGSSNLEDIRDYIRDAYMNWEIDYVLIGGDDNVIPDPWLWVFGLDENTTPYDTYMPSDLYYACLDGPYNYDGDNKWGEPTDGENGGDVDLVAEVYVGRGCVGNAAEVNNFVTKTVAYINKDPADEYLTEVCLAGEHLGNHGIASWGGNYLDQLINGSTDDGYTTVGISSSEYDITTLYDRDWPGNDWPKSEIMTTINNGVHIINHLGHSGYTYNMKMYTSDVQSITNDKYCFIYSQGCMAGGFDDGDCIAEYFTVKTNHSAFAVIMNARYGWFWSHSTDGDSQRFQREFWDAVFGENTPEIGKANHDSKENNLYIIGRSCIRWVYYETNLFGDPSLSFYETGVNDPPETPRKPSEKPGEQYTYTTDTTDPDGDQVSYMWDWGDGTNSGWIGPYDSGATCEVSHSWTEPGDYEILAKARDIYGGTSDWSEPLIVHIKLPIIEIGGITSGLLKVKAVIKNTGNAEATDVNWCVKLEGDFILLGGNTSGDNLGIPAGGEEIVRSSLIFGFGNVAITVTADEAEQTATAFIFGPFVLM
ncbi:MAG: PKD domain-containing protein [Thermoplasmatales archaeon]|nr:PKD domain-containing protein [Thermoplasmatales archaeon]